MTVHMASIVSMTVRLKLSMTVRLGNIVDDSPLEAVSMTVHIAWHLSMTGQLPPPPPWSNERLKFPFQNFKINFSVSLMIARHVGMEVAFTKIAIMFCGVETL
jgi:hypothetical protein